MTDCRLVIANTAHEGPDFDRMIRITGCAVAGRANDSALSFVQRAIRFDE